VLIVYGSSRPGQVTLNVLGAVSVSGDVSIGSNVPTAKLNVHGDVSVTGDVVLTGADCAEQFDVSGSELPEPGTVVVIDEGGTL
jgi:hypothetical protein